MNEEQYGILLKAILDSGDIETTQLPKIQKLLNKHQVKFLTELDKSGVYKDFSKLTSEFQRELKNKFKIDVDETDILSAFKKIQSEAESTKDKIAKIQNLINNNSYDVKLIQLESNFKKMGLSAGDVKKQIEGVNSATQALKTGGKDNLLSNAKSLESAYAKANNQLKILKTEQSQYVSKFDRIRISNSVQNYLEKNSALTKEAKKQLQLYFKELQSDNISVFRAKEIKSDLASIDTQMRTLGKTGKSLGDKFKEALSKFGGWALATGFLMTGAHKVKEAFTELKEIDTILTEISKTSNATEKQLKQTGKESFDIASKYGLKASNYLLGVQEMNRSGFYGESGSDMAELSTLAQSAGDMQADVANKYILATNAAYKYKGSIEELMSVIDGCNQITNRNSVNMTDMAEATTKVGNVAADTNVKVNQLNAVIGTAVARTKKEGNEVGTAIKSIFINLQNISSSKILGTLEEAGTSMTTMRNGIEEMRTPIEILKDLAKTYNSLNAKDPLKSMITTNLGGKICLFI